MYRDCFYCGEEIKENQAFVIDKDRLIFHVKCYLEHLGIYLDLIDCKILDENEELF